MLRESWENTTLNEGALVLFSCYMHDVEVSLQLETSDNMVVFIIGGFECRMMQHSPNLRRPSGCAGSTYRETATARD
jgi:hypothetical protein